MGLAAVFLSTIDRQLDGKRRIVLPVEFRAAVGPLDSLFCMPSIEADCLEGGGPDLLRTYEALIGELPFGDPLRSAIETSVRGGFAKLTCDPAGRVTLPEAACDQFGLTDWVSVVGMGDRFQIWSKEAFAAHRERQRLFAREELAALRMRQRAGAMAAAS
jgi:MraZ protein